MCGFHLVCPYYSEVSFGLLNPLYVATEPLQHESSRTPSTMTRKRNTRSSSLRNVTLNICSDRSVQQHKDIQSRVWWCIVPGKGLILIYLRLWKHLDQKFSIQWTLFFLPIVTQNHVGVCNGDSGIASFPGIDESPGSFEQHAVSSPVDFPPVRT